MPPFRLAQKCGSFVNLGRKVQRDNVSVTCKDDGIDLEIRLRIYLIFR